MWMPLSPNHLQIKLPICYLPNIWNISRKYTKYFHLKCVTSSFHPLGFITWTSMLIVQKVQTTVGVFFSATFVWPKAVLQMGKQFGQTLSCVHQGWMENMQTSCRKGSVWVCLCKPQSQNCTAGLLSTALLQVTGGGRARIETTFEFHRLTPEQDLEHFLHFQPTCQWVLRVHLFLHCTALNQGSFSKTSVPGPVFLPWYSDKKQN